MIVPSIKKILYATDLTKSSLNAFSFAAHLAYSYHASIIIVHCVAPPPAQMHYRASYKSDKSLEREKIQEKQSDTGMIKKHVHEFCRTAESQIDNCMDLVSTILVKEGNTVEEILNAAASEQCDMIVLGNHAKGFLRTAFLGSVAQAVVERSPKPVFVVPPGADKRAV